MTVLIRHKKDKESEALARFHRVVCDQPFDEEGGDAGMTPPELMLSALGCCAMHYACEYLRARGLARNDVEIHVSAEKGGRPVRLTEISFEVDAPGLSSRVREGLVRAIQTCVLHRTMTIPPHINVAFTTSVVEGSISEHQAHLAH